MGRLTVRRVWMMAAMAPAAAAVVAHLALLVLSVAGRNPFWQDAGLSFSEAAAQRDAGEVVRFLEAGADPRAVYHLRPRMLDDEASDLTPMDAAIAAGRDEIIQILVDAGVPDPRAGR